MKALSVAALLFAFYSASAWSQTTAHVDAYSPAQLVKLAQPLHAQARSGNGTATAILAKYPSHYTMLVYREKTGEVELHQQFTDVMFILRGQGVLVSGGTMAGGKAIKPGELRGTSLSGGVQQTLSTGSVIQVPPGLPHQMQLAKGQTITYVVEKVQAPQP